MARKWIKDEPNTAFREFLEGVQVVVTGFPDDPVLHSSPAAADKIIIPQFRFKGLHPDSFHLVGGPGSVLGAGTLYSRLAVTAFLLGKSEQAAFTAFNERTYEQIGYFAAYQEERSTAIDRFAEASIDIEAAFERWEVLRGISYILTITPSYLCSSISSARRLWDNSWSRRRLGQQHRN